MTFWAEITKGLSMCVLDERTIGGVDKGATICIFAETIPVREYEILNLKKIRKGLV